MNTRDMGRARAAMELTDRFEETIQALRGFQVMLGNTLAEPSSATHIADGICALLRRQVDDLQGIGCDYDALVHDYEEGIAEKEEDAGEDADTTARMTPEERIAEIMRQAACADAGRPAWHDLDTIATRARVRKCDLARVMFVLTGEDHEGPAYRAWDGNLSEGVHSHLLTGLCWEAMSRGDMWGQVSTATGLDLDKVKEVLQAMLEYSPRRESISLEPFADVKAAKAADTEMRQRVAKRDAEGVSAQTVVATLDSLRGADLEAIARSTNLAEATVRKVVERLLAAPHEPAEPVAPVGKAV